MKSALVGLLAGAVSFGALEALRAQSVLSVAQLRHDPKAYVGSEVEITGIASHVRTRSHKIKGRDVPYVEFDLHEANAKGGLEGHYVYVAYPAAGAPVPSEGETTSATGTLDWPWEVARIEK